MAVKQTVMESLEILVDAMLLLAAWIDRAFREHVLISNIISAGCLLALGDLTVQMITAFWFRRQDEQGFDLVKSGSTFVVGLVLGVFNHFWYSILEQYLHGHSLGIVIQKIVWDQAIAGPFFSSAFLVGMGLLEGRTTRDIYGEWRYKFLTIYKADWMFWPAAQFINFYTIPQRFRVLYVNVVSFLWNIFLCYTRNFTIPSQTGSHESTLVSRAGQTKRFESAWRNRRSRSDSPSFWRHQTFRTGSKQRSRPRRRLLKQVCCADRRSKLEQSVVTAGQRDRGVAGTRIRKYLKKKKKKQKVAVIEEVSRALDMSLNRPLGSPCLELQLQELYSLLQSVCKQMCDNQAVVEKYLRLTTSDLSQLQGMCNFLHRTIEETKRGAVNIALQMAQRVQEERQLCIEEVRHTLADVTVRLELLLQGFIETIEIDKSSQYNGEQK